MTGAVKNEVAELLERKIFKLVLGEDLPKDSIICLGLFVVEIKSTEENFMKFE